jgi:hypothetical protein
VYWAKLILSQNIIDLPFWSFVWITQAGQFCFKKNTLFLITGDEFRRGCERHQGKALRSSWYTCQVPNKASLNLKLDLSTHFKFLYILFYFWNLDWTNQFFQFQIGEPDHLSSWRGCHVPKHHPHKQAATVGYGNLYCIEEKKVFWLLNKSVKYLISIL